MIRTLAALVALAFCCPAQAVPVVIRFLLPTEDTANQPIAREDLISLRLQWSGRCPGFEFVAPENNIVIGAPLPDEIVVDMTPGNRCVRMSVTLFTEGAEPEFEVSAWSNVLPIVVPRRPRVPGPVVIESIRIGPLTSPLAQP